jgi:hypothetical protein
MDAGQKRDRSEGVMDAGQKRDRSKGVMIDLIRQSD